MPLPIERDNVNLFRVVATVCIAFALWMFLRTAHKSLTYPIGAFATFAGVYLLFRGARSGNARCPGCGGLIFEIRVREPVVLCLCCNKYMAVVSPNEIDVLPEDRVERDPVFGAAAFGLDAPKELAWPAGCCVCEAPATRSLPAILVEKRETKLVIAKLVEKTTYRAEAPHCDQHADGAVLVYMDEQVGVAIAFRSYPYFRKFAELNGVAPRRLC